MCINKKYIFLTDEGSTICPTCEDNQIEIDNLQVVGWANGIDEKDAFKNLIDENQYLIETGFDKIISFELASNAYENSKYFYISELTNSEKSS